MSSILKPLLPIHEQPGMPEAIGAVVAQAQGYVCAVCGLERMGHAPESEWLGYSAHAWEGTPATPAMLERAAELTGAAYRTRRENGTHTYCGHRYGSPACKRGECIHVGGHCAHCL